MALRPDMGITEYLKVLSDWKWFIFFNFLYVLFGAAAYLVVVPSQYKSTTTILITPQRVPENYVQSTVSMVLEGRLSTIEQQVTSRTVLSKVINEVGLFPERRKKIPPENFPTEAVIKEMRKRVEIDVVRERGNKRPSGVFSISFIFEDPKLAMLTASRLATHFIEENLQTREQQAVGTSEFLESQLQETKQKLEIQEEKVKRYKLRYLGELPQEVEKNMGALSRLQDQYRMTGDRIRAAEERRVTLEARRSNLAKTAQQTYGGEDPMTAEDPARLLLLKRAQIAELSTRYTESHPTLINLRKEVAALEKKLRETPPETAVLASGNPQDATGTAPADLLIPNREREELRLLAVQIASANKEIASLTNESNRILREIAILQERVDRAPRREQELIALTRDYDNLRSSYDGLLKKRLEANISQNLEERNKGEQFEVLDPANFPENPFKPDTKEVLLFAFLIACGLGFGGAIGLEGMDQTLRGPKDFQHFFKLRVLASIPELDDSNLYRQKALRLGAIASGFLVFFAGILVFFWFYEEKIRTILGI